MQDVDKNTHGSVSSEFWQIVSGKPLGRRNRSLPSYKELLSDESFDEQSSNARESVNHDSPLPRDVLPIIHDSFSQSLDSISSEDNEDSEDYLSDVDIVQKQRGSRKTSLSTPSGSLSSFFRQLSEPLERMRRHPTPANSYRAREKIVKPVVKPIKSEGGNSLSSFYRKVSTFSVSLKPRVHRKVDYSEHFGPDTVKTEVKKTIAKTKKCTRKTAEARSVFSTSCRFLSLNQGV